MRRQGALRSRLCAIHAIELYLNGFLLSLGNDAKSIRSRQHNLADRSELALKRGLKLRKRTAEHLVHMTDNLGST